MLFADQRDAPSAQLNTSLPGYNYDIDTEGTPILQLRIKGSYQTGVAVSIWELGVHVLE